MLEQLDQKIFLLINSWNSPGWDNIMWFVSGKLSWLPLYLFIIGYLIYRFRRSVLIIIPLIAITVTLTDQLSVYAFKEVFQRLRPCHEPALQGLVHLVNNKCGGNYGFVSSHAANTFGVAILTLGLLKEKWYSIIIIAWALLIAYSRVYLGVHYPGDVICGALLGALIGYLIFNLFEWIESRWLIDSSFFNEKEENDEGS